MIEDSIKVKNYKCFSEVYCGFDKILPINIIIGKNNSGKSSLIELVEYVISGSDEFNQIGRDGKTARVTITHNLTEAELDSVDPEHRALRPRNNYIGNKLTYILAKGRANKIVDYEPVLPPNSLHFIDKIQLKPPLFGKSLRKISAERDLTPETESTDINLNAKGVGATSLIQQIIIRTKYNRNLIEKDLLASINEVIKPDIYFKKILIEKNDNNSWEVFFEDEHNSLIAISKMGSGIKTVILVLLNLIVIPKVEDKSPKEYVFTFEELENNIHPSLQRRLFTFIKDYSKKNGSHFFITTHSNIVIDSFSTYDDAQILHVRNDRKSSSVNTVLSVEDSKRLLRDLDIRASDLLQSNGIIWVEGPSDRIYINRWLNIVDPTLKEGLHYSIMFYGGRLLSNLSFDHSAVEKELIPLLQINQNAFVIIDRDTKSTRLTNKLSTTKRRIEKEIGSLNCWITKGREIENYLSGATVKSWMKERINKNVKFEYSAFDRFEQSVGKSSKNLKPAYNYTKVNYAQQLVTHIEATDLSVLDLTKQIKQLIKQIKGWNSL